MTFCAGGSVTLTANSGYNSYNWSTGESSQSITVSSQGTYTLTATSTTGCTTGTASVAVNVTPATVPTFAPIPPFCEGTPAPVLQPISLNGIAGSWSPPTISNTTSGTYIFTPMSSTCNSITSINTTVTSNTATSLIYHD